MLLIFIFLWVLLCLPGWRGLDGVQRNRRIFHALILIVFTSLIYYDAPLGWVIAGTVLVIGLWWPFYAVAKEFIEDYQLKRFERWLEEHARLNERKDLLPQEVARREELKREINEHLQKSWGL